MITLLKKLVKLILTPLIKLIDFPIVPDALGEYITRFLDYIKQGMAFIEYFLPMSLVRPLLTFVIACELMMFGYRVVMWILKKIPMLGIE